jgi:FAD/FMN-containing dehydrogenase
MTSERAHPSRRSVLRAAGGWGLTAALVACSPAKEQPAPDSTSSSGASSSPAASGQAPTGSASAGPTRDLAALSKQLSRPLLVPGGTGYGAAARLYNPRFDAGARPAAIAACHTAADVTRCVRYAAETSVPMALRSGGHSYGGWSTGPGLVVDVSPMSGITIDTAAGTARIGAGAKLASVYQALGARGVALAGGSCPTVGITGLTLGGGIGVLSRAFGLTCDALRSVRLVTADGTLREVDTRTDPDLFWALSGGGGGSFGAVTALTVAVRPAPTVTTFYLEWDLAHAEQVLTSWQRWLTGLDNKLWTTCKLLADPGKSAARVSVSGTWIGVSSAMQGQLAPLLRTIGAPPSVRQLSTLSYPAAMLLEAGCDGGSTAQCLADALGPAQRQPFSATSAILTSALPAAGVGAAADLVRAGMNVPKLVEGGMSFDALGGAVAARAASDSAFVHRGALASIQYTATWAGMSGAGGTTVTAPFDTFVRGQRAGLSKWTGTSAYVNYADPAIADYGQAYWGANYPKLQTVKKQYDPSNLFTFAQAVKAS